MVHKIFDTLINMIIFVPFWGAIIITGLYMVQDLVSTMLIIVESIFKAIIGG